MLLYIKYILWFQRRFYKFFSHNGVIDPQGVASFDPRDLIGRIYVGDHLTLQHTKYINCEPHGFSEEDF